MKKLAVMQPYLFPYMGYFQLINSVDEFVLFDNVNFIKRGWINRNNILSGGKAHLFSLPLHKVSQNDLIYEVNISETKDQWLKKFIKTLELSYKSAPNYKDVIDLVTDIIGNDEKNMSLFLGEGLKNICRYLGVNTKFSYASELQNDQGLRGQQKILDLCIKSKADVYVNASGGKELYNREVFLAQGVDLRFIKTMPYEYCQGQSGFVPNLSIIDVLMFCNNAKVSEMLKQIDLEVGQ
ncbi:WbqC family protein [Lentisphaera marina]|uniref:WbqC family protein n=1 Tax=Lentisphaera marina TaxID=1111041 RepID=UPI00236600F2|nr:WbqC family protein [Lentisphaera marina]MDD7985950.1 WbqC family protein [Lentisphaera marina]